QAAEPRVSDCPNEFLHGGNRWLAWHRSYPVLARVDFPQDLKTLGKRFGDADIVERYSKPLDAGRRGGKTLELWPADWRLSNQQVIDAGVGEDLRLFERRT